MTERIELECEIRTTSGKGAARKMRQEGLLPGVLYGGGSDATMVTIKPSDLEKAIHRAGTTQALMDLVVKGGKKKSDKRLVMIQDIQTDAVGSRKYHIDFVELKADQEMRIKVPLRLVGDPVGLAEGNAELQTLRWEIDIVCQAGDMPAYLEADVSGIEFGDTMMASQIELPEGISLAQSEDFGIAKVAGRMTEEEAEALEAEELAGEAEGEAEAEAEAEGDSDKAED